MPWAYCSRVAEGRHRDLNPEPASRESNATHQPASVFEEPNISISISQVLNPNAPAWYPTNKDGGWMRFPHLLGLTTASNTWATSWHGYWSGMHNMAHVYSYWLQGCFWNEESWPSFRHQCKSSFLFWRFPLSPTLQTSWWVIWKAYLCIAMYTCF